MSSLDMLSLNVHVHCSSIEKNYFPNFNMMISINDEFYSLKLSIIKLFFVINTINFIVINKLIRNGHFLSTLPTSHSTLEERQGMYFPSKKDLCFPLFIGALF